MDWELYERYRSTLLLAGLLTVSSLFLAFQKTSSIQHFRAFLARFALPPQQFLTQLRPLSVTPDMPDAVSPQVPVAPQPSELSENFTGEDRRKFEILSEENKRLLNIVELKREKWPKAVVAHVAGRDPQRWFQEIVLDKGKDEGLDVDQPVLAVMEGHEALLGRIVEVSAHISKVMLLQDSLSSVAASIVGDRGEDGVVEGTNAHELMLKFLDRGSQVKIGDIVVTSGLGKSIPPNVPIGWVETIEPDPRQLFLQAKLRSAVKSNELRLVLVLVPPSGDASMPDGHRSFEDGRRR